MWLVAPTHLVSHRNGWEAHIYIAESLQRQLESPNYHQRANARSSVAINFRKACKKKYPQFGLRFVEWDDLSVEPLHVEPEPGANQVWDGAAWRTASASGDIVDECDECPSCDQGYHERCRNNCPLAVSW